MREAFAHHAVVLMAADADTNAIGGAVTVALCGSWEHDPPCPLAPHHTRATRTDTEVSVRVLFATEPGCELLVRERIDAALAANELRRPDGVITRWDLVRSNPSRVDKTETGHAQRLINSQAAGPG